MSEEGELRTSVSKPSSDVAFTEDAEAMTPTEPALDGATVTVDGAAVDCPADPSSDDNVAPGTIAEEVPSKFVVFGIDFGTQKCVLARFQSGETYPKIVLNKLANHHTPNVLSFQFDRRRIGEEAASGVIRPKITVNTVQKLFLGRSFDEPTVQNELETGLLSAKVVNHDGRVGVEVNHCGDALVLLPEQVAAGMFAQLQRTAAWHSSQQGGLDVVGSVVAVPGCFSAEQRRAVLDACQIAGLRVLSVVEESTAAAVCYLMQHHHELQVEEARLRREQRMEKERLRREKLKKEQEEAEKAGLERGDGESAEPEAPNESESESDKSALPEATSNAEEPATPSASVGESVDVTDDAAESASAPDDASPLFSQVVAIVDVGHRYMGAAIVRITYKSLEVLSSVSSSDLGAAMFDRTLVDHMAKVINDKYKINVHERAINLQKLLRSAEKAKKVLSTLDKTFFEVENVNDRDFREQVTRADMEAACSDGLLRLTSELEGLVAAAEISVDELVAIEVVGGGSRIPSVAAAISKAFNGRDISRTLDSAHSVAEGASVLAAVLAPQLTHELELSERAGFVAPCEVYLSKEQLENGKTVEGEMRLKDERAVRKEQVYNELESYIFYKKSQLSEGTYESHITTDEKTVMLNLLSEAEGALDSDKELEVLVAELAKLKEDVHAASPGLHAHLLEVEEKKKAALKESEEHLKKLQQEPKEKEPRTVQEKITAAVKKKHQGNVLYKEFDYTGAVKRYSQALEYLNNVWDVREADKGEIESIKLSCHLNIAACCFKSGDHDKAVSNTTKALAIDADNVKALFRRAQSNFELKAFHESRTDLEKAFKLQPKNKEVRALLIKARREVARAKKREKAMYGKMFG